MGDREAIDVSKTENTTMGLHNHISMRGSRQKRALTRSPVHSFTRSRVPIPDP
jgi:hypothetical protein